VFTVAGQAVSWLELVAAVSGVASVWLAQRMHVANWPAGMLSVLCLVFVFFGARLYADALLQAALFVLCAYGWWRWTRDGARADHLPVLRARWLESALGLVAAGLATAACAGALMRWTDSPAPWPDAAILMFSLLAITAQAHRRLECWMVWIAVDLVAIPLYWSRGLPLTTGLYLLFLLLCIGGWMKWERRLLPSG
jgi:nicotinamide mononucleotide transporter